MIGVWRTPGGHPVEMEYREGTNDWNTITSVLTNDEYGMQGITGTAVDVGAYLGATTVALLMDNDCRVIAIEPVPGNLALLHANLARNGLSDRCSVIEGAVGTSTVKYGWEGSEMASHHAWVGNANGMDGTASQVATVHMVTLAELGPVDFIKIDCEGGEWGFLDEPDVPRIVGEWHPDGGYTQADLLVRLPHHAVTFSGPVAGPGGFEAVLR